ncbi:MAG: hypothetical protein ACE5HQ_08900 [Gemmatimonadota bacterium]
MSRVVHKVRPLLEDLVFVGGAVMELYFTDPASPRVRPTTDTDAICGVTTYVEYHRFGERLNELGFTQSAAESDPPYRWTSGHEVLDVIPAGESVFGFSGRWHPEVLASAVWQDLEPGLSIRLARPEVLLATKLEAHEDRGSDDPLASRDLEDIVVLIANRPELVDEVLSAAAPLRAWVRDRMRRHFPPSVVAELVAASLPEVRIVPDLLDTTLARIARLSG